MKNQEIKYLTKIELQESLQEFRREITQEILPALKKEIIDEVGAMLTEVMNVMAQSFQRLEEKFDALSARLDGLTCRVDRLSEEVTEIKGEVHNCQLDIVALNAQTRHLNNVTGEIQTSQHRLAREFAAFLKTRALEVGRGQPQSTSR